ncbi:MAG: HAD-IIIA family hydrolase [Candidatus Omnitrophica bacterium]|nr:HAD-IIIA family hydrolase [Candidatus Omnitrophota bacterium]
MSKKIVFLDRDGVINEYPGDGLYVLSKEQLRVFPYAGESIRRLKEAGYLVYIISNQACVSKGLISVEALKDMTGYLLSSLEQGQELIDGVYYCTHREEENCPYRKPSPALILEALRTCGISKDELNSSSFFIGDSLRDVKAAKAANLKSIIVLSGRESIERKDSWEVKPDYIFKDLKEAVDFIVKNPKD